MGKLYKRNQKYYADYETSEGQRRRVSLGTSDRQVAKAKLRKLEMGSVEPAAHETQGLTAALDHLLDVAMPAAGRAAGTIHCYEKKGIHLVRLFGRDANLNDLTRSNVQQYVGSRLDEGASRGSIHKELVTLRQVLAEAKRQGLYFDDPSSVVPSFAASYEPKTRWLPPVELERLVSAVNQPRRKLWVMVAAFSGARDSEVEGLQWENVHLDRNLLRIRTTKTKGGAFWRDVPILAQLRPWLEGFAQDIGPVVEPWDNVRRDLHAACDRLDPKIERCSPNDLRRTFCSYMLQSGVPVIVVAKMMGHKSTRMVEQVYGQLGLNSFLDAGEKCAAYVTNFCADLPKTDPDETQSENSKPLQIAQESGLEGFNEVPGDRIELPTRGFSVPELVVLNGGKSTKKKGVG